MARSRTLTLIAAAVLGLVVGAQAGCHQMPMPGSGRRLAGSEVAMPRFLQQASNTIGCANVGDQCGKVGSTYMTCVGPTADVHCDRNPNVTTHTCQKGRPFSSVMGSACTPSTSGEPCSAATGAFGDSMSCNNGKCGWSQGSLTAGDYCETAAQCASNNCVNNMCVGLPTGVDCSSSQACAPGNYCNYMAAGGAKCTALPALGEKCDYNGCQVGAGCSTVTHTCVAYFSLPDGSNTSSSVLCAGGALDRGSGGSFHQWGTCVTPNPDDMGSQCTGDKDGMSCICPIGSPPSTKVGYLMDTMAVGMGTLAARKQYINCGINSGCPLGFGWEYGNTDVGSCLYYRCNSASVAAQCSGNAMMTKNNILSKLNYPQCMITKAMEYFGNTQSCDAYFANCVTFPNGPQCK